MHTSTQSSMSLNSWIGGAQINYVKEATTGMFDASDDLTCMCAFQVLLENLWHAGMSLHVTGHMGP